MNDRKKNSAKDLEEFARRKDELNPRFIFSLTYTQLLVEALRNEFDIEYLVRLELANRGFNADGKWVGFAKAREVHGIAFKTKK